MIELILPGMTCGGCARSVTAAIKSVDPTAEVIIDAVLRKIQVTTAASTEAVKTAIKNAGYMPS